MRRINYLIVLLLIFCTFSCNRVRIIRNPITIITSKPNHIDSIEYEKFLTFFNGGTIRKVPDYYGGLNPKYNIAELWINTWYLDTINCMNEDNMNAVCMKILIIKDGIYELIDTKEKLKKTFAPIENEEEALSYVSIYTYTEIRYDFPIKYYFRTFVKSINKSYAIKKSNGYETITYDYDVFNCGPHTHYRVKSFVDFDGNVKIIEKVKIYENPKEDNLCID